MVENLIHQAIVRIPLVQTSLARYQGAPAVFHQRAPDSQDVGWDDGVTLPQIDYHVDWQKNAERKADAALCINVWCEPDEMSLADSLVSGLREELSSLFLTDSNDIYAAVWWRTEIAYRGESLQNKQGYTLYFDLLSFFVQETIPPDPVQAMIALLKQPAAPDVPLSLGNANELRNWQEDCETLKNAKLIGHDSLPPLWKPSAQEPAIYVRLLENSFSYNTAACSWLKATVGIHVILPIPTACLTLSRQILHEISLRGELLTADGSPFLVKELTYTAAADSFKEGQLTLSGEYGVEVKDPPSEPLRQAAMKLHHRVSIKSR